MFDSAPRTKAEALVSTAASFFKKRKGKKSKKRKEERKRDQKVFKSCLKQNLVPYQGRTHTFFQEKIQHLR